MSGNDDKPDFTIAFHDEDAPVGLVIRSLRLALKASHEVRFMGIETRRGADDDDTFSVHFRLRPVLSDGQGAEMARSHCSDRIDAHCDLLDGLDVPNGRKAIAIALHAHWSERHQALFGDAANPDTVKRWRTERSVLRSRKDGATEVRRRRSANANRVVRRLRRRHAIQVNASGDQMRAGYRRALAELHAVNAGGHPSYGSDDASLPSFSYETFRRDCHGTGDGHRERPSGRRRRR